MKTYIDQKQYLQLGELFIPRDPTNRHYCQYLEELKEGNAQVVPCKEPPVEWTVIRAKRNALLLNSDWTQLSDSPLTEQQHAAWKQYRQALRDLPNTFSTPETIQWPETPTQTTTK